MERDGRRASVPDEVRQQGSGMALLDEPQMQQQIRGLEPDIGLEVRATAPRAT